MKERKMSDVDYVKEIERRNMRIKNDEKRIRELREEIAALHQLLDCAAANISMLVSEQGGTCKISAKEVGEILGKFHLRAECDDEGNYLLQLVAENSEGA